MSAILSYLWMSQFLFQVEITADDLCIFFSQRRKKANTYKNSQPKKGAQCPNQKIRKIRPTPALKRMTPSGWWVASLMWQLASFLLLPIVFDESMVFYESLTNGFVVLSLVTWSEFKKALFTFLFIRKVSISKHNKSW